MEIKKYSHGAESHGIFCRSYVTCGARLHWHEFYELELVLSGTGTHVLNGTEYPWERGRMHLLRLSDLRLEYAASLVRTTPLTSTRLAEAAGFGSLSHFLRCFKQKFGVSPGRMKGEKK